MQSLSIPTLLMVLKSQLFWKKLGDDVIFVYCSFKWQFRHFSHSSNFSFFLKNLNFFLFLFLWKSGPCPNALSWSTSVFCSWNLYNQIPSHTKGTKSYPIILCIIIIIIIIIIKRQKKKAKCRCTFWDKTKFECLKSVFWLIWCEVLTAHNWQKWKSIFLTCPYHKIDRVEAVGLKTSNYTLKIKIVMNKYVKFGAILWKIYILSITA